MICEFCLEFDGFIDVAAAYPTQLGALLFIGTHCIYLRRKRRILWQSPSVGLFVCLSVSLMCLV